MDDRDSRVLQHFKSRLLERLPVDRVFLFGSRARGDARPTSDMDVVVIVNGDIAETDRDIVSDCAWEAGFEQGLVIVPIVYTSEEWDRGPDRASLLAQAVEREGVLV